MSPAAVRLFMRLCDRWRLAVDQRRALLGDISRPTYHNWRSGRVGTLTRDQLERISLLLGIHKGLELLFADEASAMRWFASPNKDLPFGGISPLGERCAAASTTFFRAPLYRCVARHEMSAPARAHIRETTHRLIASRFPPVGVFDDLRPTGTSWRWPFS